MRTTTPNGAPHAFRIAIYADTGSGYTRKIIQGSAQACVEHGMSSKFIDTTYGWPDPNRWKIDGAIATIVDDKTASAVRNWGIPVINVSSRLLQCEFPSAFPDNRRVGEIAAQHFLYQKSRTFVTRYMFPARFVEERIEGFQNAIEGAGHSVHVFRDVSADGAEMLAFLKQARKPVGFFVLADSQAYSLMEPLADAGLVVPRDVQLIGVDNDELLCLMTNPRLSSVDANFEIVGETAVKLLRQWLLTGKRPPDETRIPPRGLVIRQSSNLVGTKDELVNQALQLIRAEAQAGISVKQLSSQLTTSRRRLELRFHEALDSTPAKEILRVQVEHACQLLVDTELPLHRVAEASGLGTERQMRKAFRRTLHMTPSGYREQFRPRMGRALP